MIDSTRYFFAKINAFLFIPIGMTCLLFHTSPALAWRIQNDWRDGAHVECMDCGYFGSFEKIMGLGDWAGCPGDDTGCGGGTGARLVIKLPGILCKDVIFGHRVPARGKVRIYSSWGKGHYDIYDKESDSQPSWKGIPFGQSGGEGFTC